MLHDRLWRMTFPLKRFIGQSHVIDQATGLADLGHDVITRIDTQRTGNTGHLLAVTNVDTSGAHIHAGHAINTVCLLYTSPSPRD